jgi:hypothetical protein
MELQREPERWKGGVPIVLSALLMLKASAALILVAPWTERALSNHRAGFPQVHAAFFLPDENNVFSKDT